MTLGQLQDFGGIAGSGAADTRGCAAGHRAMRSVALPRLPAVKGCPRPVKLNPSGTATARKSPAVLPVLAGIAACALIFGLIAMHRSRTRIAGIPEPPG